jgi:hypothetical protein
MFSLEVKFSIGASQFRTSSASIYGRSPKRMQ